MRRLTLDHITVVDTTPAQLVETAATVGCRGVCLFLQSMDVLASMPTYDLVSDAGERRRTRQALDDSGVQLDMAYPFTVTGRTVATDLAPYLDVSAELGAGRANVLCYDRDPLRRLDTLGALADLAQGRGITLCLEFYPPSQVRTLDEAFVLVDALGRDRAGVTLDLLHLARSGGWPSPGVALSDPRILLAQVCDGPMEIANDGREVEAGRERMLPGRGVLGAAAFVAALRSDLPLSIEAPRGSALEAGLSVQERARLAVEATREILGEDTWQG